MIQIPTIIFIFTLITTFQYYVLGHSCDIYEWVWQWVGLVVWKRWWRKWNVSPCEVSEEGREGGGRRERTADSRCCSK